jgi:hypothetical protein
MNSPETPVSDLLLILAPPLRLVDWLEKVFYQRKVNGEEVPENFVKWLERWQRIRSDLPSEIDGMPIEKWAEVERKVFGKREIA